MLGVCFKEILPLKQQCLYLLQKSIASGALPNCIILIIKKSSFIFWASENIQVGSKSLIHHVSGHCVAPNQTSVP